MIKRDSSSATLNTIFKTPSCASDRFNIFESNIGPISESVTLIGIPFSPNKSQNSTGYSWKLNPFSSREKSSTFFAMKSFVAPTFTSPETSPFISAKNTGTPKSEKDSAKTFKVTVLPVPVAPAITPCLLAIFGNKNTFSFSLHPTKILSSAYIAFHPFSIFLIK